jgi:hypothetical protein
VTDLGNKVELLIVQLFASKPGLTQLAQGDRTHCGTHVLITIRYISLAPTLSGLTHESGITNRREASAVRGFPPVEATGATRRNESLREFSRKYCKLWYQYTRMHQRSIWNVQSGQHILQSPSDSHQSFRNRVSSCLDRNVFGFSSK